MEQSLNLFTDKESINGMLMHKITLQITQELLQDCYNLYPVHSAQAIKEMLLDRVGNIIDDIIINNAPNDIEFLKKDLKQIKPRLTLTLTELWDIALTVKKYIIENESVITKEFIEEVIYKENIPEESILVFYDMLLLIFINLENNLVHQVRLQGVKGKEIINTLKANKMLSIIKWNK